MQQKTAEIVEYVYSKCANAGMTKAGIYALLANLQKESLFIPNNLEDTANRILGMTDEQYTAAVDRGTYSRFVEDGFGYGLFQVTYGPRKKMFLDLVRKKGGSIGDYTIQVEYILWELPAYFPGVWKLLCTSDDVKACTWELLDKWENPKEKVNNMTERYGYAIEWQQYFSGKDMNKGRGQMTQNEAIGRVLDIARAELGYREKATNYGLDDKNANAGSGNWTKYARDLDSIANFYNGKKNGYAWCDIFHDWLHYKAWGAEMAMKVLCQPHGSAGAGCMYSAQYYQQAGRWSDEPHVGDQIFFYSGGAINHTGIVESVSGGIVTTIEGNTTDMVARRTYQIGSQYIAGYGRPRYELVENMTLTPNSGVSSGTYSSTNNMSPSQPGARPMLRRGATGPFVRELQEKLTYAGYNTGGVDGEFGIKTWNAVRVFQQQCDLEVDGIVGPQTWSVLDEVYNYIRWKNGGT